MIYGEELERLRSEFARLKTAIDHIADASTVASKASGLAEGVVAAHSELLKKVGVEVEEWKKATVEAKVLVQKLQSLDLNRLLSEQADRIHASLIENAHSIEAVNKTMGSIQHELGVTHADIRSFTEKTLKESGDRIQKDITSSHENFAGLVRAISDRQNRAITWIMVISGVACLSSIVSLLTLFLRR